MLMTILSDEHVDESVTLNYEQMSLHDTRHIIPIKYPLVNLSYSNQNIPLLF